MRVRYTGLPGYVYTPTGAPSFAPRPGEVIDLPAELVDTLGADFEPLDAEAGDAGEVDRPDGFDPGLAKKAELLAWAADNGLELDRSARVADLRAAVVAAIDTAASADGGTDPTGQEG